MAAREGEPPQGCPMHKKGQERAGAEPPDEPDRPLANVSHVQGRPCQSAKVVQSDSENPLDIIPGSSIPAAGRGNSEDGQRWLNPSASQLFRSMQRKDKPIELEDALSVAAVHQMVTDSSWEAVMEYEALHAGKCGAPTLARFEGKDGIYSPKARFMNIFGWDSAALLADVVRVNMPFDRHDWYIDRCGKEVRYIIDYYADGTEYFIDAR